jgi:hypothetical protein
MSLEGHERVGSTVPGSSTLDQICGTEWTDYERLYTRITGEGPPLTGLRERVE